MGSFGATLDACVIIPACLRDTLLWGAHTGLYRVHWSREILEEVRRNLVEQKLTSTSGARSLIAVMNNAFPDALVQGYERLIPAMPTHEKDRHVAAAAVVAHCQVIVTTNLRHFPKAELSNYAIEAQSPDEFLCHLFDLAPDPMVRILHRQSEILHRPPISVDEILENLARNHAPNFVAAVRDYMARNMALDLREVALRPATQREQRGLEQQRQEST